MDLLTAPIATQYESAHEERARYPCAFYPQGIHCLHLITASLTCKGFWLFKLLFLGMIKAQRQKLGTQTPLAVRAFVQSAMLSSFAQDQTCKGWYAKLGTEQLGHRVTVTHLSLLVCHDKTLTAASAISVFLICAYC